MKTRQQNINQLRHTPRFVAPNQKATVDHFRPEDAEGVARLYLAVYGDTFPIDYVYDPDLIREANADENLHQIVARTPAGDVVGLSALFRVSPGRGIRESGGLMILPEYRMGTLMLRLIDQTYRVARDELRLNTVFGQSVTDHMTTQKINRKYGLTSTAFEIESMQPRPDGDGTRISLLNEFKVFRDIPHGVHLPEVYGPILNRLYDALGVTRERLSGGQAHGMTTCQVTTLDTASLAKMAVTRLGTDCGAAMRTMEDRHPGRHGYQLQLPLTDPGLPMAVDEARRLGYCFAGLLPLWTDTDVLLLQKVEGDPDFSAPNLLTELARELAAFVQTDRKSLTGR
jgi:hypothetical protein